MSLAEHGVDFTTGLGAGELPMGSYWPVESSVRSHCFKVSPLHGRCTRLQRQQRSSATTRVTVRNPLKYFTPRLSTRRSITAFREVVHRHRSSMQPATTYTRNTTVETSCRDAGSAQSGLTLCRDKDAACCNDRHRDKTCLIEEASHRTCTECAAWRQCMCDRRDLLVCWHATCTIACLSS